MLTAGPAGVSRLSRGLRLVISGRKKEKCEGGYSGIQNLLGTPADLSSR